MPPDDPHPVQPPTPRPCSPTEPGGPRPARAAPPPERIGRYRILAAVESGGMGRVYRAHDPQLDRVVALKVPRVEAMREGPAVWAQRFLREAQSAARVRHPNVCPIYDVGEHDGAPFVVMAFIDGPSLAECLRGPSPYEEPTTAALLVRQVADGLAAVHDCGLIHRDIKPANVLIERDGQALLTDFGLARPEQDLEHLTAEGVMVGTPAFMAPEQACGEAGRVGPWTDVYSLGVVLYRLLAGRLPFVGTTTAVLWKIGNEAPPPPSEFRPGLDPALEALVRRAMALRIEDRYATARAFAADLGAWLAARSNGTGGKARQVGNLPHEEEVHSTPTQPYRLQARTDKGGRRKEEGKQGPARPRFTPHPSAFVLLSLLFLGAAGALALWSLSAGEGQAAGSAVALVEAPPGPEAILAEPLALAPGAPLSSRALVSRPAPVPGVRSWTVETREPRGRVRAVAYRADGGQVALAGNDGMVRLLEIGGGKLVRLLVAHGGPVRGLAWSPNGRFLASAGEDGVVSLWDAGAGALLRRLRGGNAVAVHAVAWSPGGEALASAGADGRVRFWRAADGAALPGGAEHTGPVLALAWSPDGARVASAGADGAVRLWDMRSGQALPPLEGRDPVRALAWSADSRALAAAGHDQRVRLWDTSGGKLERELAADAVVTALAWAPAPVLAAGTAHGVQVHDAAGRLLRSYPMTSGEMGALAWSPDGKVFAAANQEAVRFIEAATGKVRLVVPCHPGGRAVAGACVAWSPDGRTLALAGLSDRKVRLWDAVTGRPCPAQPVGITDGPLAWSPDGKALAVPLGTAVRVWDHDAKQWVAPFLQFEKTVLSLAWSPDGKALAVGADGGPVWLWRAGQSRQLVPPGRPAGGIFAVAWSPDGKFVAGGADGAVFFWEVAAEKAPQVLAEDTGAVRAVGWSPDGKVFVSGDGRGAGRLRLWKSANDVPRQLLCEVRGHRGGVSACAWSPDGRAVASAGADGAVRFWEARSGQPLGDLEGHTTAVSSLAWHPKGGDVAAAGHDGSVRVGGPGGDGPRAVLLPLFPNLGFALSPEGHWLVPPERESSVVVVVQTDAGQESYPPGMFRTRFLWPNDPNRVRLAPR